MNHDTLRTNKLKLIWGIICLVGPITLIVASILIYAIVNFILGSLGGDGGSSGGSLFSDGGAFRTVVNVVLYLVGAVSILSFIPGIVVGIILLATRK